MRLDSVATTRRHAAVAINVAGSCLSTWNRTVNEPSTLTASQASPRPMAAPEAGYCRPACLSNAVNLASGRKGSRLGSTLKYFTFAS